MAQSETPEFLRKLRKKSYIKITFCRTASAHFEYKKTVINFNETTFKGSKSKSYSWSRTGNITDRNFKANISGVSMFLQFGLMAGYMHSLSKEKTTHLQR